MYMKKIFIIVILSVILNMPAFSACTVTGGACSINDIIKNTKNDKQEQKQKKSLKHKTKNKINKTNTVKNNYRTRFKTK